MSSAVEEKKSTWGASLSKASALMGAGPPLCKQLKFAILEGNEEKAISLYNSKEMGKTLKSTLHPSKPFPSKKDPNGETPLHLSAKNALPVLFGMFLEFGGRPDILNSRRESCAHTVCTEPNFPDRRADIVEQAMKWRSINPSTNKTVSVLADGTDIDGNTAMHLAAYNGLLKCLERLIAYRASCYVLNNNNLTCAEFADVSGRSNIGTMIELASLFNPSLTADRSERAMALYRAALQHYRNNGTGVLVIDSHSLTATGLMKFVTKTIAAASEALKESAARTEVMLMHYNWDAHALIADYERGPSKVMRAVKIQPRGRAFSSESDSALVVKESEGSTTMVLHGNELSIPVGVPIAEVYMDPSFAHQGPFAVMRGEKRVAYTIRAVNGRTAVVPFDFDAAASPKAVVVDDQKVSPNSELKPEPTSPCPMCGEMMLEAASVQHFMNDTLVQPKHRELQCGSGHKYCFSCWADYLQAHAGDKIGLHALNCPNVDCGDALDLQWAPVLLRSPDLVNRVLAQRQRQITDRLRLHWCSVPKCGLIIHVHSAAGEEDRGSDCMAGSIPLCGLCANGHGVCLCCGAEPHAPSKCDDVTKWQDLTREVSRLPPVKDRNHPAHAFLHAPQQKPCAQCGVQNAKEAGSNHIRCTGCFREFCWMCQKDWSLHTVTEAAAPVGDGEEVAPVFQCNTWVDPPLGALSDRHNLFFRYFTRYQAHLESFNLELAMRKACMERVQQGLKVTHEGELHWLLTDVRNPYEAVAEQRAGHKEQDKDKEKEFTLSDAYLPRDKAIEFLLEAFQELEKCRMLLRWSYPYAMFQYEEEFRKAFGPNGMVMILGDRSAQRAEFLTAQNVLERQVETLSDLLSHRRLRGNRDDVVEAYLAAKAHRIALESVIVGQNPTFGSQSMDFSQSRSVDERHLFASNGVSMSLDAEGSLMGKSTVPRQASSNAPPTASTAASTKVSSYTAAMEFDVGVRQSESQSQSQSQSQSRSHDSAASTKAATAAVTEAASSPPSSRPTSLQAPTPPRAAAAEASATKFPVVEEPDSDGDYGYGSGDDEGLQVCTDIAAMKLDGSPKRGGHTTGRAEDQGGEQLVAARVTVDAERSTERAEEVVSTVRTTKMLMMHTSTAGQQLQTSGSNNSLMSDLTQQDFGNSGNSLLQFAKVSKLESASKSPKPPVAGTLRPPPPPVTLAKSSSLSAKQLSKEVSRLFVKQIVEHIDEQEARIVYQLMSKHKITREKAVRMFLEEHDERLYNPKAVYLFPGEEYTPEQYDSDSSEERRKEAALYGRVEYNQKRTTDSDSVSEASPATIEQRLIGAKKDPDQEALEHALLLSAQEEEFGVNMYDSLTSDDQITLREYMSQGFTREEAALLIFEEKFGKTHVQDPTIIPAMPTLRPVYAAHSTTQSHAGTDRSSATGGLVYASDEDDDEEVEDLIRRGYTREQAIAVIRAHREKARRAAETQHPTDPTHYYPHPDEERFNLSEREEREVETIMSREGYSRRIAVETVVQRRPVPSAASVTSHSTHHSYEDSYNATSAESAEVRKYMDRGYSREQALQIIKHRSASSPTASASTSGHVRRPSYTSSTASGFDEDAEVTRYMNRGYTRDQARELVRRSQGDSSRTRLSSTDTAVTATSSVLPPRHRGSVPANLDPETADLVRMQMEDHGTNMFVALTPADDPEIERLTAAGYQYNEALLEIFNYRYPPLRAYDGYPPVAPGAAMNQSFYQQSALPPQYAVPAPQPYYGGPQVQGYVSQQAYYMQPQAGPQPVMHSRSFYQVPGPSHMVMPDGTRVPIDSEDNGLYPIDYAPSRKASGHARKPSGGGSSSAGSVAGGGGRPPVINGSQTLLEQRRQDAKRAAQEKERVDNELLVQDKGKEKILRKKSSFLGGMSGATRKSARGEDDLVARASHMSDVDNGKKDPTDKSKVPKLKYNEADVQKIIKMGFTRDQAVQALVECHHNVDAAAHMLTENVF